VQTKQIQQLSRKQMQNKGASQVLNNKEAESLTILLAVHNGAKDIGKQAINRAWENVQAALLESTSARAAMATSAAARHAANPNTTKGRPPSQWFQVDCGNQWRVKVLGMRAAMELVNTELAKNKMPLASYGSLSVKLSTTGQWWRVVETFNGRQDLGIRKCGPPKS
jgi:hypothetical protein